MKRLIILILLFSWVEAGSTVTNSVIEENNYIGQDSYIDESIVEQGKVQIINSLISDSDFKFNNEINASNIEGNSFVRQSVIVLENNSKIKNSTFQLSNSIKDSIITNTEINQSIINLDSSIIETTTIKTNNSIKDLTTGGKNYIIQAGISMLNSSNMKKSTLTLNNSIENLYLNDGFISQSEITILDNSAMDNVVINNTNKITGTRNRVYQNSYLIQGKIEVLNGATLSNNTITLDSTATDIELKNSRVEMCGQSFTSDYSEDITKTCTNGRSKYSNVTVIIAGS